MSHHSNVPTTVTKEDIDLDHTPLTFGKHKGKTPDEVSEDDPGWICWAYENVKNRKVCSRTLYEACLSDADYISRHRVQAVKELDPDEDLFL